MIATIGSAAAEPGSMMRVVPGSLAVPHFSCDPSRTGGPECDSSVDTSRLDHTRGNADCNNTQLGCIRCDTAAASPSYPAGLGAASNDNTGDDNWLGDAKQG